MEETMLVDAAVLTCVGEDVLDSRVEQVDPRRGWLLAECSGTVLR